MKLVISRAGLAGLLILTLCLTAGVATPAPVRAADWRESGLTLPTGHDIVCLDGTEPNTAIVSGYSFYPENIVGTFRYNWTTNQLTRVSDRNTHLCGEDAGLFYSLNREAQTAIAIGRQAGQDREIPYLPVAIAQDGSRQVYALKDGRLYHSPDGLANWTVRGQNLGGAILSVAASTVDAKVVYVIVKGADIPEEAFFNFVPFRYTIYYSDNAGQTWARRGEGKTAKEQRDPQLETLSSRATPVNWIVRTYQSGGSPSSFGTNFELSTDGGSTFSPLGFRGRDFALQFFRTNEGIVRLRWDFLSNTPADRRLEFSANGRDWSPLSPPVAIGISRNSLWYSPNAPDNLWLYDPDGLWHSPDAGRTWHKLAGGEVKPYKITPYAPTTLLGLQERKVATMYFPQADLSLSRPRSSLLLSGGRYIETTRHNMSQLFVPYYDSRGGLARFGHPWTEAIREYNPADGKIYTVQYFERNRFEYHPELAGGPYEVLLGLLGNQLTEGRRAETPFHPVANPNRPDALYFPQTGHTLAHSFKEYWEKNGGLAVYGYPVSEEFQEVNPDDGRTYTVQYFERNRFEYHPELKNTPYEVLLGLLGNTLLRDKGWL